MRERARTDRGQRAELRDELLPLHARILLRMPVFELALIGAIGWIVLPDIAWSVFLAWAAVALGVECARAATARGALARLPADPPQRLHQVFVALDGAAGLATGSAAVLFLPHIPLLSQALLETTLYTVAGAGIAVAVSSKRMLAAYSSLVLIDAATAWSMTHPDKAPVAIALTAVYWLFLIGVSADSKRLLRRSIDIRRQRDEALGQLERRNQEMQEVAAVSHDLRHPLHALSAYSAVLLASPSGPDTAGGRAQHRFSGAGARGDPGRAVRPVAPLERRLPPAARAVRARSAGGGRVRGIRAHCGREGPRAHLPIGARGVDQRCWRDRAHGA